MYLPDNNVLINAFRADAMHHKVAKDWLEGSINSNRAIRLFPTIETGFLRVVTHPKIFDKPSPVEEASYFLETLCSSQCVDISPWTASIRSLWMKICTELKLVGNDCNDAMLAAVCLECGLRLVTFDQGFRRFPNLLCQLLKD